MSGDQRRDRPKTETASGDAASQRVTQREVIASDGFGRARLSESEPPTRPRGRTIDSETPADSHDSGAAPALRATQDSFHPVRVPARSTRPPLSLWTRAWATMALVIVVAGGAIGIVTSLRARALLAGHGTSDPSARVPAPASASMRPVAASEGASAVSPAAAPGFAAPPPGLPSPLAGRSATLPTSSSGAIETTPGASSQAMRPSPSAVVYRTPESLAVSPPPVAPIAAPSFPRRKQPVEIASPSKEMNTPPETSAHAPTPAPASSDTETTESEAWVTEERRF